LTTLEKSRVNHTGRYPGNKRGRYPQWQGGEILRKAREEAGWSYLDLERQSGMSSSYLRQLETDPEANPSIRVIMHLAGALGVDPVLLMGD